MIIGCKLSKEGSDTFSDPTMYRLVTRALQYARITRLDFSMNKICQFMSNPLESRLKIFKQIQGTTSLGILLKPNPSIPVSLQAFCDAGWDSNHDAMHSTNSLNLLYKKK